MTKDNAQVGKMLIDNFAMGFHLFNFTINCQETLNWVVADQIVDIEGFAIMHHTEEMMAGTYRAAPVVIFIEDKGDKLFFKKSKMIKMPEWYVF